MSDLLLVVGCDGADNASAVVTAAFNIRTAAPTFSYPAGTYPGALSVSIADSTSGALIYYTTDGSTPTTASLQYSSSSPISVSADETLKAIAVASGYASSAVVTHVYNIQTTKPIFSPPGTYSGAPVMVTITATSGAVIYYTNDGTVPTATSSQVYSISSPISVSVSETLKAIAVANGYATSGVTTAVYKIH